MDGGTYNIFDFNDSDLKLSIVESNSNFNQHRRDVIKYAIEKNLSVAIANFNNYSDSTTNFQMPKLKETEWDKILNHISIISFLQGLNIGGKVYNGYSIITNTKNKEVVSEDSIYILTSDGYYHNPLEQNLESKLDSPARGILNIDLERRLYKYSNTSLYYYPINALGDYSSIVSQNNLEEAESIYQYMDNKSSNKNLAKLYYTALARERYEIYRIRNNL